ncbi:MAG: hypothetical protein O3B84_03620, partial [Chloroflexi bacterium]|nr:hypothetical protein [Chloroflexota bacterium]
MRSRIGQRSAPRRPYATLGIILLIVGPVFAVGSWATIEYMPLVALGTAAAFFGIVSLALANTLPEVSPETSLLLIESGFDNTAALIEETGVRSRAIYLPCSVAG